MAACFVGGCLHVGGKDALNDSCHYHSYILGVSSFKLGPQETFFSRFRDYHITSTRLKLVWKYKVDN